VADPDFLAAFHGPVSDPNGLVALLTEKHDVGEMKRRFFLQDSSAPLLAMGTGVPLDEIDLLDDQLFLLGKDLQDAAALSLFFPLGHHDEVVLLDVKPFDGHV